MNVNEEEINGFNKVTYRVGFRLYPDHFRNSEDENDTYDKHLDIWKKGYFRNEPDNDSENEKYLGDIENFDENIPCYSKRIPKFNTFSRWQQKNLDYIWIKNIIVY